MLEEFELIINNRYIHMDKKEFVITRVFDAPQEMVWKMWTTPEFVKKWWGPKPFTAPFADIDFRVGGKYLYCMRGSMGPGQPEMDAWSAGTFEEIVTMEKIVVTDYFSNEKGEFVDPVTYGMPADFPKKSSVTILFEDLGGKTRLSIIYPVDSQAALDSMLKVQMKEGWESSLDKLGELLASQ